MTRNKLFEIHDFVRSEMSKSKESMHNWDHIKRVSKNAIKIVEFLKVKDDLDLKLLLAACYLHDLAISQQRFSKFRFFINYFLESFLVSRYLPNILLKLDISLIAFNFSFTFDAD